MGLNIWKNRLIKPSNPSTLTSAAIPLELKTYQRRPQRKRFPHSETEIWCALQSFTVTSTSIQSKVSLPGRSWRVVMAALLKKKRDKKQHRAPQVWTSPETEAFIIQQPSPGHNIIKHTESQHSPACFNHKRAITKKIEVPQRHLVCTLQSQSNWFIFLFF